MDGGQGAGLVPARLAVTRATLVDQSPCSRRAGRSRWTSAGSTARSRPLSAATVASAAATAAGRSRTGRSGGASGRSRRSASGTDIVARGYVVPAGATRGPDSAGPADGSRVASSVERVAGCTGRHRTPSAPVAQRIERRPPEPKAQVRFLPGALPGAHAEEGQGPLLRPEPGQPCDHQDIFGPAELQAGSVSLGLSPGVPPIRQLIGGRGTNSARSTMST